MVSVGGVRRRGTGSARCATDPRLASRDASGHVLSRRPRGARLGGPRRGPRRCVPRRATRRMRRRAAATRSWCAACATARTPSTRVRDATRGTARWRATRRTTRAASSPSTATPSATPCGAGGGRRRERKWPLLRACAPGRSVGPRRTVGPFAKASSGDDEVSSVSSVSSSASAAGTTTRSASALTAQKKKARDAATARAEARLSSANLRKLNRGEALTLADLSPETMRAFERGAHGRAEPPGRAARAVVDARAARHQTRRDDGVGRLVVGPARSGRRGGGARGESVFSPPEARR